MPVSLSKAHRKLLENTTAAARVLAESACRAALENLAVHEKEYRGHMSVDQRKLRNRLRARGRAVGDARDTRTGLQDIHRLVELAAYEHWHRLLFTRFLTENHLLITDEANGSVPITLEECEELAPDLGARDGLDLACRFASRTLPGVFRRDDPVLDLPVALNDQVEMRRLLANLPSECFRADDALGWTYQFWQAQRKKEVNDSGTKIGADELSPVTQLFTEDYMVEFLLHNTLGAWWFGKLGAIKAENEEQARAKAALPARAGVPAISWTYLRFVQDEDSKSWVPAAGTFDDWPRRSSLIRLLDPCMGSGHFLVFALPLLIRFRMEEEQLDPKAAVVAVLNDNIYGLELDERCTQIAAFNVALTAWKIAGYQTLPPFHLACCGNAPSATESEWTALAGSDERLRRGMMRLYGLFKDAPVLGSLINPRTAEGDLLVATFHELQPLLEIALAQETNDDAALEMAVTARGIAKAAAILATRFNVVATNVPYLGRGRQEEVLRAYCERVHPRASSDLATCFVERCLSLCVPNGCAVFVTPQNWLFLGSYRKLREQLLDEVEWKAVARLGSGAFETISGEVVNVALILINQRTPRSNNTFLGIDCSKHASPVEKALSLLSNDVRQLNQAKIRKNPDSIISIAQLEQNSLLSIHAVVSAGSQPGQTARVTGVFWETPMLTSGKVFMESSPNGIQPYSGKSKTCISVDQFDDLDIKEAVIRGKQAWGRPGVIVSKMAGLPAALYCGCFFDDNTFAIVPRDKENLPAFWAFVESGEFANECRKLNQKLNVTVATMSQVGFNLAHWQTVAADKFHEGLPKPHSDDPTQWLFSGNPKGSTQPLHVAVARFLGYQWPRQTGSSFPDCPSVGPDGLDTFAAHDGIVCLPPVNREQPAANRLRQFLAAALDTFDERSLIASAGLKGSKSNHLEEWLRDEFFEQHAKLFDDRPFIWHLWDGRLDGFHALVNYHKLDNATLLKLTYSYLGSWIQQQTEDAKADKPGAAARLGAARTLQTKLAAILEGEAPLDIFARWKPIKDQAQGWHPDLNDGLRQNVRPFLLAGDVGKRGAGLFRTIPLTLKDKDGGSESSRTKEDYPWYWCEDEPGFDPVGGKTFVGIRWNNVHLTLEKKRGAKA